MNTQQLRDWDNDYVWHPFAPMSEFVEDNAPIIEAAEGFELIDTDGNRYLDGVSSLWCNMHGHRVPEVDAAVREQLDKVAHSTLLGLSSPPSIQLAKELVDRTPVGLNKVFYSDSGATSVEVALKIAYQYHLQKGEKPETRDLFVGMASAYHGDTVGSVSVGGMPVFHGAYERLLFKTLHIPSPVTYRTPDGVSATEYLEHCYRELETTLRENQARIAAFIIEPLVQGAAGMLVHPDGYLCRVRELTAELGILLIADEVAVGFGRTGTMFACEQEDVQPDLMCVAKGITAGYLPVAATLVTDEIYGAFLGHPSDGRTFYHGHTYTGNPLGCAAGLASLELLDRNGVLENVRGNSEYLAGRLSELSNHPHVGHVRQKGIMAGVELVQDKGTKAAFPAEQRIGHRVTREARKLGLVTRPLGDVIVLMPAPGMPREVLAQVCDRTFEAIDAALVR
ncbi:MAG: adenosylmethionine--8-amino-7-oxononanoate transaminase [Planctomycetaceae bacterium]|nr:adenosylmethionine--8-amino-7-oxononanoate transaminase [Planctomycetaceae bacterium]